MPQEKRCDTQYPILLVHGAFFRDVNWLKYWGRIPKALEAEGARVYFGQQQSAESAESSAEFLANRIEQILAETGCPKVNVIAHSKGGLDMRCAIAHWGAADKVASLTTVSTPHRGCRYVDHLLQVLPRWLVAGIGTIYNIGMWFLGDRHPDFGAAIADLTEAACLERDKALGVPEGILCRSMGSCLEQGRGARGFLRLTHSLVKKYDGQNDGLVGTHSMSWGESFHLLEPKGRRGISHWDATDLHRETLSGFDPVEYYINMVYDLKKRGL